MNKHFALTCVGFCAAIAISQSAHAGPEVKKKVSFTATQFREAGTGSSVSAPVDPVKGSFTLTFDPTAAYSDQKAGIASNYININVDSAIGFDYSPVGFLTIGGLASGVSTTVSGTNDFVLGMGDIGSRSPYGSFVFSQSGNNSQSWIADSLDLQISPIGDGKAHGKVTLTPSGIDMEATFIADRGLTLDQAAALGGFDHFNWLQVGQEYPGRRTPFIDPPLGGWWTGLSFQPADDLNYYWDEGAGPGFDPRYNLADPMNTGANFLSFSDTPVNSFIIPGVNSMKFFTSLVGVYDDSSWKPLYSWSWESDARPPLLGGGGDVVLLRNIDPFPGAEGSVFNVTSLADPLDAPPEILNFYRSIGMSAVPEPSTWIIMIVGFGCIGGAMRRKNRQRARVFLA